MIKLENILVTAALPYVNGPFHIGGLRSTYIPADVFVRYHRLKKNNVVFVSGSDEYGTPTVIAAEQEGLKPKVLVDKYHAAAQKNLSAFDVSFDHYSRTLNPADHELTQQIFRKLFENKYVYKKIVKEHYCEKCKKFLPDRYVRATCPSCGAKDQYGDYCESCGKAFEVGELKDARCAICSSAPILRESEHYIFKLSAFSFQLLEFIKRASIKDEVKNYILNWIKEGLRDWDIVRDLDWGVPLSDEFAGEIDVSGSKKVFYVWFNAPIGYIAATKEWSEKTKNSDAWEKFWIAEKQEKGTRIVHFIGKDIIYHHCLFWPAMMIGTGTFSLPTDIIVRGHATLQGKKFSKSRKYWILLEDFLAGWPADYLRFYYSLTTPNAPTDGDFDWKDFQDKINTELLGNVGNFIHRTLTFLNDKFKGAVPEEPAKQELHAVQLISKLQKTVKEADKFYAAADIDKALKSILAFSASCNQYFQHMEPWKNEKNAPAVLYNCVNAARSLAILLAPIIPASAEKIWAQLNLEDQLFSERFETAAESLIQAGHKIKKPEPLFKKAEDEKIAEELEKLKKIV